MPRKQQPPNQKSKKKKGHQPAHQNEFAFRHNPKSKLTEKILASPNVGVCQKCHDKIEWRKQFRKYKPLSQPSTCNLCKRRNITAAYHSICDGCAKSNIAWKKMLEAQDSTTNIDATSEDDTEKCKDRKVCAVCVKEPALKDGDKNGGIDAEIEEQMQQMEEKLNRPLKLRESKAIERRVTRTHEREKERLKAERRKARDEEAVARVEGGSTNNDTKNDEEEGQKGEVDDTSESVRESLYNEGDDDPFLHAVGGRNKLLTGEAYQQMMLEKARSEQRQ